MSEEIFIVGGARPNFMKIAPLIKEMKKKKMQFKLIHTGQHYDYNMSKIFFEDLGIPKPDFFLAVGSDSHASQTAKIMIEFEKIIKKKLPRLVIVVGDVNSTIACALVAKKLNIMVAHIEAGLRSFDRRMPEEINRILTDQISDFLFTTEISAEINLKKEGIDSNKIFFVGNIMIDTLLIKLEKLTDLDINKYKIESNNYALMTIHRPSNVDTVENLSKIIEIIDYLQKRVKIVIPLHPRTKKNLLKYNLYDELFKKNIKILEPLGYLEFLNLMVNAKFILTDSGGIQEEASYLKVPVLTMRENTERPITIEKGSNTLVGTDMNKLKDNIEKIFSNSYKKGQDIDKWDGNTAKRIVEIIYRELYK